ncbi:L,D-transpeptidase [Jatrophihabitans fulvus]
MNDDSEFELERRLRDAFTAQARADVPDHAPVPPPRFADPMATAPDIRTHAGSRRRWAAPLAAAAAVLLVGAGAVVLAERSDDPAPVAAPGTSRPATLSSTGTDDGVVRVTTLNSDDSTYGVGMPVIAYFSQRVTDGRAFQAATRVTANGRPLTTAWYFQRSAAGRGPVEGQLRPKDYWPANATIRVTFPPAGTSMGKDMPTDGRLTSLTFKTGPRQIATVDDKKHELVLTVNGKRTLTAPVALGAPRTPTRSGIKVVMEQQDSVTLKGPGLPAKKAPDAQRLTYDGEYLHAAPWNEKGIEGGKDNSNGCTNLMPKDAAKLYKTLRVGDVVVYEGVDGPAMQVAQGYGAWNMSWREWVRGGLIPTR